MLHEYRDWLKDIKSSKSFLQALKFTFFGPEKIEDLRKSNKSS